ncbi:hypothetical protein [Mediterraneibacter sp.]|uniref:hypothetical protein n=1 Tax=Mediterraneibacter sp. TaxID=2316022 RepID=UPI0039946490
MAYRSQMGYINAVALPDNMYQNEINHWRMRMTLIIVASFLIFALSVFYLYRIICLTVESISKANGTDWKRRSSGGA